MNYLEEHEIIDLLCEQRREGESVADVVRRLVAQTKRRRVIYAKIDGQDIRHVLPEGMDGELHHDKYKKIAVVTLPRGDLLPDEAARWAEKVSRHLKEKPFFQDGIEVVVVFEGMTIEFFEETGLEEEENDG